MLRKTLIILCLVLGTAAAQNAAEYETNTSAGMTLAGVPLAIHGYDPVSFFTTAQPRIGKAKHTVAFNGAAYRFESEGNKQKFEKDPARYAPQFGGYCAYGVALGAKFDGDPRLYKIVDGKLYFNLNPDIQNKWLEDVNGNIDKADDNWTKIRTKSPTQKD
ncbi:MAG: hypothetical protein CL946_13165 [Ectothiorhodospiraceae bacterium]|nr:hypothetical protein [Ectothiorhodospiraceae bacterium]